METRLAIADNYDKYGYIASLPHSRNCRNYRSSQVGSGLQWKKFEPALTINLFSVWLNLLTIADNYNLWKPGSIEMIPISSDHAVKITTVWDIWDAITWPGSTTTYAQRNCMMARGRTKEFVPDQPETLAV